MATVTFDHVYKRFPGDVIAVNDLNLQVADGEFLVLVGPSGCGKTTALRCVAGLETISDGKLLIGDRSSTTSPPKDRDIAMVFQSYALYPHMTVFDNLAFGLKLRKMPKAEIDTRVREAAGILGLDKYLDRKPKALSGGQRQRVAPGPRDRPGAEGVPDGRAALQPRRQAAGSDSRRDRTHPPPPGHDDRVRHPRPGRGDDDGRPDRGHEGRAPPAGRHPAGRSTTTPPTCSWRASSARPP